MSHPALKFKTFKQHQAYEPMFDAMKAFTLNRCQSQPDEVWFLEHQPVFTQGQAGKPEHILNPGHIPIVQSDRGGQVTYHGPGQLMIYVLWDIKRLKISVRKLVHTLEELVIQLLAKYDIPSHRIENAPGIYVKQQKIASLGLRIKKGCSYHGISLNVDMDLNPFDMINPCGFQNLQMTQMSHFCNDLSMQDIQQNVQHIISQAHESFFAMA